MLADDSAVIRGLISRWLEQDGSIQVAAYAANGTQAVKELERHDIDVIILDADMPEMDGLQALPQILRMKPDVRVIMACTLSHNEAEISIRALKAGAADYVVKPHNSKELQSDLSFRRELIEKIKALAGARRRQQGLGSSVSSGVYTSKSASPALSSATQTSRSRSTSAAPSANSAIPERLYSNQPVKLRPAGKTRPEILAIGSSTGGPQALFTLFTALQGHLKNVPVVITQHMPADFTSILTEHLSRVSDGICKEGENGEEVIAGNIYLAPGNHHMLLEKRGSRVQLRITQDPPENFCRPAVDPMMRSLKSVYHDRVLAVILTGMGQDGLKGCRELVDAGSTVLAQDEASSVVWGMPGAVATNGLCSAVLALDKLANAIAKLLRGQHL